MFRLNRQLVKRFTLCGLAAITLVSVAMNLRAASVDIWKRYEKGLEYREQGRAFTCGRRFRAEMIMLAEKHVKGDALCAFWMREKRSRGIAAENRIAQLNYYLYPAKVVICTGAPPQDAAYLLFSKGDQFRAEDVLEENGLSSVFELLDNNEDYFLFQRRGHAR